MMKETEHNCKCVVCKTPMDSRNTSLSCKEGPVCSAVCVAYLKEREKKGLHESDDLNEVQLLM